MSVRVIIQQRTNIQARRRGAVLAVLLALLFAGGATAFMGSRIVDARFERDISRIVFNDNLELLQDLRQHANAAEDSLLALLESPADSEPSGAIIISITDNRLWYRVNDSVVFETSVATGSGKVLEKGPGGSRWKFETPRGRLQVRGKEEDPAWVPPDWHFVEQAEKRGLRLTKLNRGESIDAGNGSVITVSGSDVVRKNADGSVTPLEAEDGREIVVNGQLIVPPFGTNQRRYKGVLGTHRLLLGDGYAIHGTNVPQSIGQSVSHGCVRLLNEDIAHLYQIVPVGTPVYIY
ncbi:MAG TPA: L,D-transpeptidase [Gemmatimonadaceae bacterium]|nr:L,D-transpeptidase [Gemmatimonadaceae bacterium]